MLNKHKIRRKCCCCGTACWVSRPQPTSRSRSIKKPRCKAVQPIGDRDYKPRPRIFDPLWYRNLPSWSVEYFVTVVRASHIFHCTSDTAVVVYQQPESTTATSSTDSQHGATHDEPNFACWGAVCAGADRSLSSPSPTPNCD